MYMPAKPAPTTTTSKVTAALAAADGAADMDAFSRKLFSFGRQHSLRSVKAQDTKLPFRPAELAQPRRTTGHALAAWLSRPGWASVRPSQQKTRMSGPQAAAGRET